MNDIHPRVMARKSRGLYSRARQRLREIERVISDRHGRVPETDDADLYLKLVANCFQVIATGRDRSVSIDGVVKLFGFWCQTWAPHLSGEQVTEIVRHACSASPRLKADDVVGKILRLCYADRDRLRIRTIGSFDADRASRKKLAAARKRERDRLRIARKRRANGAVPRAAYEANSLSKMKLWEKEGICRRTYERRQKKAAVVAGGEGVASASPHKARVVASPSPHHSSIEGRRTCDTAAFDLTPNHDRRAPEAPARPAEVIDVKRDGCAMAPPPLATHRDLAIARAYRLKNQELGVCND